MQLSKLQGDSRRHCKIINGAAGKKKWCKDAGFTPESLNKPFFAKQKKENGAAGKKKYGLTPRAKRAEIFLGCTSVSAASRKKIKVLSCQSSGGRARGPQQCPKPPTFFFFFLPRDQGSSLKGALFKCCWFAGLEKNFPRLKAVVARFARASLPTTEWRGKG